MVSEKDIEYEMSKMPKSITDPTYQILNYPIVLAIIHPLPKALNNRTDTIYDLALRKKRNEFTEYKLRYGTIETAKMPASTENSIDFQCVLGFS